MKKDNEAYIEKICNITGKKGRETAMGFAIDFEREVVLQWQKWMFFNTEVPG